MNVAALLINLIVWGLIFAIIWWAITQIPVPAPFNWVIRAVFALLVVLMLLSFIGAIPPLTLPLTR